MTYTLLKFIHILSASLLLGSMGYCAYLWYLIRSPDDLRTTPRRIQRLSLGLIFPGLLVQLATGFTLISLKQNIITKTCMIVGIAGFMLVTVCWFAFIFLLLQQISLLNAKRSRTLLAQHKRLRLGQMALLGISAFMLLVMIFFMSNQLT